MAKKTATPAEGVTAAPVAEGTEQAPKKAKKERLFSSTLNMDYIRRRVQTLTGKFNRVGRGVKALGLETSVRDGILASLTNEFNRLAEKAKTDPMTEEEKNGTVADAAGEAEGTDFV